MHSDTIAAFGALVLYLGLNLACVLALRACFKATFQRFGLAAVARGYGCMIVFCIAAGAILASEISNIGGDIVAQLLVLLPFASSVVLLACLLCAWQGWLRWHFLAAATLLLGVACAAALNGGYAPHFGGVIGGASIAFAIGFKHGERRHLNDVTETLVAVRLPQPAPLERAADNNN